MIGFDHFDHFDHNGWAHGGFSPYEPDTDGTEVQVAPLSFDDDPTYAIAGDDPARLATLFVGDDGVESAGGAQWSEEVTQLSDERVRVLERGEVPAALDGPV